MRLQRRDKIGIAVFFFLGWSLWLHAQNNPYKIEDSLYEYYKRMVKMKDDPICLKMVDTLYQRAFALGDKKAECLAYTIPLNYRFPIHNHYPEMKAAADDLRRIARQNGYLRYYYFATSNEVTYLLNEGKFGMAIRLAQQMHKEALADQNNHGLYSCLLALGNVYYARSEYPKALEYYTKAYNQLIEHAPEQDPAQTLSRIAACYSAQFEEEKALEFARRALTSTKTETSLLRAVGQVLAIFYECGQYDEFLQYYRVAKDVMTRVGYVYDEQWYQIECYKSLYDKDYEKAHEYAGKIGSAYNCADLHRRIYEQQGNCRMALKYANQVIEEGERRSRLQQNQDLDEMEAQARREELAEEAHALELKTDRIEAARRELRLRIIVITFLFALTLLLLYAYLRHRNVCMLQEKNRELTKARREAEEARDRAELADKMKTMFVQNMSHEIRTPLNAIVGFSSVLTDENFELQSEERKDLSERISQNSELLTTLINDVLDLSNLESGKYAMDLRPVGANVICSYALDTVSHRKPEGVELRFVTDAPDDFLLTTDGMRVQQVLVNFLTNAVKNTEQGEIRLCCSVKAKPGFVTYAVEDTGCGVPPEKAKEIFDRFVKLDDFKQGSGLGLSICALISDRLKGTIYLDTAYQGGARFVFEVPQCAVP